MGLQGKLHPLAALPPGKNLGTHFTGGWLGPRAVMDVPETVGSFITSGIRTTYSWVFNL